MIIGRLSIRNLLVRRIRSLLTIGAVAAGVCLVVAVTSGFASVEAAAQKFLTQYIGSSDAQIVRGEGVAGGMPQTLIDRVEVDPSVARVTGRLETVVGLEENGAKKLGRSVELVGIRRPQDTRVDELVMEAGDFFDESEGNVAVIDQVAADALGVAVGDTITMPPAGGVGKLELKVVGIVHKPDILARASQTIYMPLHTLQQYVGSDASSQPAVVAPVTRILIDLKPGTNATAYVTKLTKEIADWREQDGTIPALTVNATLESRADLDENLMGLHVLSYLAGGVSLATAAFIVFSTLAMGVTERQRTLAMLRAIGMTRMGVARMVMLEGMSLSAAGVVLGVAAGWAVVELIHWRFEAAFVGGLVFSGGGIGLAVAGALAAALGASLLPAWMASRVWPLEAMTSVARPTRQGAPVWYALIGALLVSIDPVLQSSMVLAVLKRWLPGDSEAAAQGVQFYGHFAAGVPGMIVGAFLLSPLIVWVTERVGAGALAWVLGLPRRLLRENLSGSMWRSAGTATALAVGLAVLVAMQTQAQTFLNAWKLPDKFPDAFMVSTKFSGLNEAELTRLANTPGIRDLMPVATAMPGIGTNFMLVAGVESLAPTTTLFIGVPPDVLPKMMSLDFRDDAGEELSARDQAQAQQTALALLRQGRYVLVTDEYRQLKGVKTGDEVTLRGANGQALDYHIAGIVWSPGIDVFKTFFDMGHMFDQRTSSAVFGTLDDARRDFGVTGISMFAANLDGGLDMKKFLVQLKARDGDLDLRGGDVRAIKYQIDSGFTRLVGLLSSVALGALAVASLGVWNTITASVRSRRWQMGVLRSVGATGGSLLRMVLAEACLLGLVGSALGLGLGLELATVAQLLGRNIFGLRLHEIIPWGVVGVGIGAVMTVSLAASLLPALSVGRAKPLDLLQEGRSVG
jgi:putative ABC transport system permease protein